MPNRYAEQYYPVAYGQPMPAQGWAPAPPVGVYPEPQPQAYPVYQPQQFAHYPANGQGAPVYAQPLPPGYTPPGYPQPMQAHPQPMSHYSYPPQHHAQPMATTWPQQVQMPYPPAQAYGAPPPAYPQMPHAYPPQSPMQAAPASAYSVAAEPRRGELIPFPPRYASETARSPIEEDNGSAGAIADIRASLAEFREAVRDFTEMRQKRRFL